MDKVYFLQKNKLRVIMDFFVLRDGLPQNQQRIIFLLPVVLIPRGLLWCELPSYGDKGHRDVLI